MKKKHGDIMNPSDILLYSYISVLFYFFTTWKQQRIKDIHSLQGNKTGAREVTQCA